MLFHTLVAVSFLVRSEFNQVGKLEKDSELSSTGTFLHDLIKTNSTIKSICKFRGYNLVDRILS